MPRQDLIQIRRDTAANWTSVDPTLAAGEFGFESDTNKLKCGDGSTAWTSLSYLTGAAASTAWGAITGTLADQTDLQSALDGKVNDTGNETIAGIKTFSSFPVTPSTAPTTDYEVANKKYVDDNAGGGSGAFTTTSNVTSNSEGSYTNDSFVFGSPSLNDNGDVNNDYRFLFDKSNGAFRVGRATGTQWDTRGNFSFGVGNNPTVTGADAIAMGDAASATNDDAIALGKSASASGSASIAIGTNEVASGANAVSIGRDNEVTYTSGVAIGRANTVSNVFAVALGQLNTATGQRSLAAGNNSTSQAYSGAAFGRFNELLGSTSAWTTTDPVFQIGIGADSGSRADAFRVLKDGVVLAPTVSTSQIDSASNKVLVTKEWIQNAELGAVNWSHFGDSTSSTGGSDWIEDLDTLVNFASVNNNATSGDRIDQQVDDLDTLLAGDSAYFAGYEIASILIGVNDFNQDIDLGTRASAVGGATVAGQMRDWIEKVLTSNPAIEIYVMTPWEKVDADYQSDNGATSPWSIKDLRQLYHEICTDYQIQCIDLYSLMGINSITGSTLTDGTVHLSAAGESKIIPIVKNAFINKNNPPLFS